MAFPQARAWRLVKKAVRRGDLIRGACARCGAGRTHGHHTDYARPLDVVWLCARCHTAAHRAMARQVEPGPFHDGNSSSASPSGEIPLHGSDDPALEPRSLSSVPVA